MLFLLFLFFELWRSTHICFFFFTCVFWESVIRLFIFTEWFFVLRKGQNIVVVINGWNVNSIFIVFFWCTVLYFKILTLVNQCDVKCAYLAIGWNFENKALFVWSNQKYNGANWEKKRGTNLVCSSVASCISEVLLMREKSSWNRSSLDNLTFWSSFEFMGQVRMHRKLKLYVNSWEPSSLSNIDEFLIPSARSVIQTYASDHN